MLVLSRKKNESIIINDNITVTVIEIRGDKVRLGIEAPKEVTVHRREVYEAIQNQSKAGIMARRRRPMPTEETDREALRPPGLRHVMTQTSGPHSIASHRNSGLPAR